MKFLNDIYIDCIQNEINNLEKEHQPVNFKTRGSDEPVSLT
jgi:hypothetical protein